MKKVVAAIDSFKGCLRSVEANAAAAAGVRDIWPNAEVREVTVSDGGEGFMEAFHAAIGGSLQTVSVKDPLMRDVTAHYLLKNQLAVIEVAEACGLNLLSKSERNPLIASTYGVGQLLLDAVRNGAENIIVGLGGSGTSDAGQGMLAALKNDMTSLQNVQFTIASDVENPLFGENGAAFVFAPQKGATAEMVVELDARAKAFAQESEKRMGFDRSAEKGAGAAGGLGYAFMQFLGAERRSGIELLLETVGFDKMVADANFIITGEGAADKQTLMGKLPTGILKHSGKAPVLLIAGKISDREELLNAGFAGVECINPPDLELSEALRPEVAKENIQKTVYRFFSEKE